MRVVSCFATKTFKLILEFDDGTYRLLNIRSIPANPKSLIGDVQFNQDLFMTATIDSIAGTVRWDNGVDFDPQMLYEQSVDLENLTNIRDFTRTELDTPITEAVIELKETIRNNKELIENYEYSLKQDIEDEEEIKDLERQKQKLKKEILSSARAIEILDTYQNNKKENHIKEKILDIYKNGTQEELDEILPFHDNFYWRFASIVEAYEIRRISNVLLRRGYTKLDLEKLFPGENTDSIIHHFSQYKGIEIQQIFDALIEIYKERYMKDILPRMVEHLHFSEIESIYNLSQSSSSLSEKGDKE